MQSAHHAPHKTSPRKQNPGGGGLMGGVGHGQRAGLRPASGGLIWGGWYFAHAPQNMAHISPLHISLFFGQKGHILHIYILHIFSSTYFEGSDFPARFHIFSAYFPCDSRLPLFPTNFGPLFFFCAFWASLSHFATLGYFCQCHRAKQLLFWSLKPNELNLLTEAENGQQVVKVL